MKQQNNNENINNTINDNNIFDILNGIKSNLFSNNEDKYDSNSLILQNFDSKSSEKIEGLTEYASINNKEEESKENNNKEESKEIIKHEVDYSFSLQQNSIIESTIIEDSEIYLKLIYKLYSELNTKINKLDKSKLLNRLLLESKMGNYKEVEKILEEEFIESENLLKKVCKNNLLNKLNILEININEYKEYIDIFLIKFKNILINKLDDISKLKKDINSYKEFIKNLNKEDINESIFMNEYLKEDSLINNKSLKKENEKLRKFVSEINLDNETINRKYKLERNKNIELERELLLFKSELYKLQIRYKKKTEIIDKQKKVLNVLTDKLTNI